MKRIFLGVVLWAAPFAFAPPAIAQVIFWPEINNETAAEIVIFGEVHDNPLHHIRQAKILFNGTVGARRAGGSKSVATYASAVVYEMLTPAQAAEVTPERVQDAAWLEAALGWQAAGWPDFSMYYPIFAARPQATVYGAAIPREAARAVMQDGITQAFGAESSRYGLTEPLPEDQQQQRNALQMAAHCDALPEEMLPAMVDIQRLRDARLAQVALQALDETGGPVLVITGNGHARKDWGVPAVLARLRPDVSVFAILQGESGVTPDGGADLILDAPAPARGDPCAAFKK